MTCVSPANFIMLRGKLGGREQSQSCWSMFALAILFYSFEEKVVLCYFSDLCKSYCSVEDQRLLMNMEELALETLGGPLTQVQYPPAVLKNRIYR